MRPEYEVFEPGFEKEAIRQLNAHLAGGTSPAPSKPAVSATRMKGAPIYGIAPIIGHEPGNVVLELTPDVAATLLLITRFIGGDPRHSRRKHVDQIAEALWGAKVDLPKNYPCGASSGFSFRDEIFVA